MSELQVFSNPEFGQVRSMLIDEAPWFVGRDVASALGYRVPKDAIRIHVDADDKRLIKPSESSAFGVDETSPFKGGETPPFRGGETPPLKINNFGMYIINESGLYSLILSSKLPSAKRFKRWVTSEVLPAIRKTGKYEAAKEEEEVAQDDALTGLPERELTRDDYFRAASIVATCRNERLPYVLSCLAQAGIATMSMPVQRPNQNSHDKFEIMRLLMKAHNDFGISDAQIGRMTGLNRKQINLYRLGERCPRVGRGECIKAAVASLLVQADEKA